MRIYLDDDLDSNRLPIPVKLSSESGEGVQGRSEATLG